MLQLHLCKCFNNMPQQDDKGDVSAETTGPAWEYLEKYADEIAFHFVFPVPANVGISTGTSLYCLGRFWVFGIDCFSSALLCFDPLLLSYVVHLILNLPKLISPGWICNAIIFTVAADDMVVSPSLGSTYLPFLCVGGLCYVICVGRWGDGGWSDDGGLPLKDVLPRYVDGFRLAVFC
ncbi:hypothetical protein V6N12_010155 [Hibiscus sabdariffa]|uniref:Uncharacterized protein n=1 Tax=Hibiscus sabdariffa TaxID=183260 RepID=A0ABR2ECV3_9ROSI